MSVCMQNVEPEQVMELLNTLFSVCDKLVDEHGIHKVRLHWECSVSTLAHTRVGRSFS